MKGQTFIEYFPNERYRLKRDIPVDIEDSGEGAVLVRWEEANIAMTGRTLEEALDNLRAEILDTYENYGMELGSLGPGPTQQYALMNEYIERRFWRLNMKSLSASFSDLLLSLKRWRP